MPYSMASPHYRYKPRSKEQREAMAIRERRRLGIPDGCAQLYGLHIPIPYADQIRNDAAWFANNKGWDEAQNFIRCAENIDWDLVGEVYDEWASYQEMAEFFGVPGWYIERGTRHMRRINPKRGTVTPRHE